MRAWLKFSWVEMKLFVREPVTLVFTLVFPLITLFVLAEVFGDTPDPEGDVYRGVAPIDYYLPSYMGLIAASIGFVSLPVHLAEYRERGVLRRLRASAVSAWSVVGAQVLVTSAVVTAAAVVLAAAAYGVYDVKTPASLPLFAGAFVINVTVFSAVGVLLGALLPTGGAAQGIGLILYFVNMMIGGAGPPPEVLTGPLEAVSKATPLAHVNVLLQDPWLGFGWNLKEMLVVGAIGIAAALASVRLFRWE